METAHLSMDVELGPFEFVFDERNKNWASQHAYNLLFIRSVEGYCNQRLRIRGHMFLNEVLDHLDLERIPSGAVTGWLVEKEPPPTNARRITIRPSQTPNDVFTVVIKPDGVILDQI